MPGPYGNMNQDQEGNKELYRLYAYCGPCDNLSVASNVHFHRQRAILDNTISREVQCLGRVIKSPKNEAPKFLLQGSRLWM